MKFTQRRPLPEKVVDALRRLPGGFVADQKAGLKALRVLLESPLTISWKTKYSSLYTLPNFQRNSILGALFFGGALLYVAAPAAFYFLVWDQYNKPLTIGLLVLVNGISGRLHRKRHRPTRRKGFDRLMLQSGVVSEVKVGKQPRIGSRVGHTVKDEFGETQKFRINGSTYTEVKKKEEMLAGLVGRSVTQFAIEQDPKDPPNVFSIWISSGRDMTTMNSQIETVTNFHEPFRLGRTVAGRPVLCETFEYNTLIAGIPGMGKTATVRRFMLRALLDPEAETFLVDGKGSKKDYRGAKDCYSGYIDGNDDDALEQVVAMLEYLHERINWANGNEETIKILLVLDEWQDIRQGADPDVLKAIDSMLIRIHKKGRATGFHLILATQRASAFAIPTEIRSLFRQALGFRQKNGTDYGMVLGHKPDVMEPQDPGQAILAGDRGQTFVLVDQLTQAQWESTIPTIPTRVPIVLNVRTEIPTEDEVGAQRLKAALRENRHRVSGDTVSPTDLFSLLPEDAYWPNVAWLGRRLTAQGINKRGAVYHLSDLLEAS